MVDGIDLRHRRHAPRRRRARRGDRRDAVDAQRERRASAAKRRRASCRAAASPTGPTAQDDARIVYVTPGYQMVALDAKTGELGQPASARTASSI